MCSEKPIKLFSTSMQWLSFGSFLAAVCLSGWFAVSSYANYSDRRQVIVFSTPESESAKTVRGLVDALRCELIDRDTDVRFIDIAELPDADATSTNDTYTALTKLARLRSDERPDFEMVLIGKDGGVKARTNDLNALKDFLALIDTMPMRRAEMRSQGNTGGNCQ